VKVHPLSGVTLDRALKVLRDTHDEYTNARGSAHEAVPLYNAYVRASAIWVGMLASVLPPGEIDQLVTTPDHRALVAMDPAGKPSVLGWLVNAQFEARIKSLDEAINELAADAALFNQPGLLVVPDTNTLLHHPLSIATIPWSDLAPEGCTDLLVVVPIRVVDELDKAKRQNGKIATGTETVHNRAQRTLRVLEEWSAAGFPHALRDAQPTVRVTVLLDDADRTHIPDADAEIIQTARRLSVLTGGRVVLAAYDLGMRLRARSAKVAAVPPPGLPDEEIEAAD
jgi:hypothetical protein